MTHPARIRTPAVVHLGTEPEEHLMAQESRLNVRVPADLVSRLDALIPKVTHLPECALLGTLDRSKVARVALLRGVAALEAAAQRAKRGDRL